MKLKPYTVQQHQPILTLAGGNLEERCKLLDSIAYSLKRKSVDMLVVYISEGSLAREERADTPIGFSYDRVFLGEETGPYGVLEDDCSSRFKSTMSQYCARYDLVIYCQSATIDGTGNILIYDGFDGNGKPLFEQTAGADDASLLGAIYVWLTEKILEIPVWGCVLVGGKSSRMGQPKHLITNRDGITWGEKMVNTLSEFTEEVVLSGGGEIPQTLTHLEQLADIPGAQGPLAGILAAMRWNPHVTFIVAACDMPNINAKSIRWLLNRRRPGVWGTVPQHPKTQRFEPLFACYDFHSRVLFEELLRSGSLRPNHISQDDKIETPAVPDFLADSWCNCNTPEDLAVLKEDFLPSPPATKDSSKQ